MMMCSEVFDSERNRPLKQLDVASMTGGKERHVMPHMPTGAGFFEKARNDWET